MGWPRAGMTDITSEVSGKSVSHVTQPDPRRLEIHFTDDSVLAIALLHGRLTAALTRGRGGSTSGRRQNGPQPTRRQRDYLEFIAKYIAGTESHRLNQISHGTSSCQLPP